MDSPGGITSGYEDDRGSSSERINRNSYTPTGTQDRPNTSGGYSTGTKSSRRKKKKNSPACSLEEVFNQVSTVVSANLNAPIGRVLLTPRSAEVCLKLGVNPEILKIRDIDSFWEPSVEPAVQRMRHEAYVQRRHETMKQCRLERKRIVNAAFEASTNMVAGPSEEGMTPEMIIAQQKEQTSTLIQLEMQRIEKMQRRQQKELESMVQFEVNRARIQQEMEERMEKEKRQQEQRKKQAEKRAKLAAEERRLREMQKAAMEEMEEETRRAVARQMHEEQVRMAEEKAAAAREAKRRAQEEEIDRKRKQEEHKATVSKYFNDEQIRLRKRMESMQYAERKKEEALLKRQEQQAEMVRERRAKAEKRIEQNFQMAQMIEEKRKDEFISKQDYHERIRAQHAARQEQAHILQQQELMLQEQRRRMILIQMKKEEEMNAQQLLQKFDEEEGHLATVQEIRNKELGLLKERKNLRTQMKYENVERVVRQNEYKKNVTLKKIEDTDSRVKNMLDLRLSLVEERRRAAASTRAQKEKIAKVMEEVRTNATLASKIIGAAVSGNLPINELLSTSSKDGGKSTKKKKSKTRRTKSASDMMDLSRNKSTGDLAGPGPGLGPDTDGSGDGGGGQFNSTEPPPSMFMTQDDEQQQPPKPYISPYEAPLNV